MNTTEREKQMELGHELGVVGTIYEEAADSLSSTISSPSHPPPRRRDPDVVIYVGGTCFRLHKEALTAKSAHLKRQLIHDEFPQITLSPPLNITAQTFSLVTDFCYGTHVAITPFNVAALHTAAELLGMTGEDNLQQITEAYFRRVVAVNKECASIVLRSCFPLLPEAACLVGRCMEALSLTGEADGYLDDFKSIPLQHLLLILETLNHRFTERHDLLYRIIHIYLQENNGKTSENEKIEMCNYIDCNILSPGLLMHAVQNPRLPLRFVVQAMFLQQLQTRHSIISAAAATHHHDKTTLGAILQRDAALGQVSHLKNIMIATNSRIETLEKEVTGMKNRIDSGRSASFQFTSQTNKIDRDQIGSVSSLSYRDFAKKSGAEEGSQLNLGRRLMKGLRCAFGLQKKSKCPTGNPTGNEDNTVIIKKDQVFHRRAPS